MSGGLDAQFTVAPTAALLVLLSRAARAQSVPTDLGRSAPGFGFERCANVLLSALLKIPIPLPILDDARRNTEYQW